MTGDVHPVEVDVVVALEERRYTAMQEADSAALSDLLSEDLVYSHSDGRRDTKQTYLHNLGRTVRYLEILHPVESVQIYGDHALVHGAMAATLLRGGQQAHLDVACLSVWHRETDTWRLVAFQPTPLR